MLDSTMVNRGFEPRSGQTKDYKIGICCCSLKHASLRGKSKDFLMCPSGATCCFSELASYKNPTKRVGLEQSGHHHLLIEN